MDFDFGCPNSILFGHPKSKSTWRPDPSHYSGFTLFGQWSRSPIPCRIGDFQRAPHADYQGNTVFYKDFTNSWSLSGALRAPFVKNILARPFTLFGLHTIRTMKSKSTWLPDPSHHSGFTLDNISTIWGGVYYSP